MNKKNVIVIMIDGGRLDRAKNSLIFNKLGIISYKTLRDGRRFAILGIFIISAILTPPDPFSQIMFVIPLIVLYEFSAIILRFFK